MHPSVGLLITQWATMFAEFPVTYYWSLVSISFVLLFDNQPKIVCIFFFFGILLAELFHT